MNSKISILKKSLNNLEKKIEDKRDNWLNAGTSNSDEAYNDLQNILNKYDALEKLIEVEEAKLNNNSNVPKINNLEIAIEKNNDEALNDTDEINKNIKQLKSKIQLYSATKKDGLELVNLRDSLLKELIDDFDDLLNNSNVFGEIISYTLFYKIIDSETLTETIKLDIHKIRESSKTQNEKDKEVIGWWYRYLTVIALTISIIKFRKFDYQKADFLIDFLTDKEDKVWEAALVGICVSLTYRDNKWTKHTIICRRLKSLQSDNEIQDGLDKIDNIWRLDLYKNNFFSNKINTSLFFENNAHNWFIPFYENNQVFLNSIECCNDSYDIENFKEFIYNVPLLDSYKYLLCEALAADKLYKLDVHKEKDKQLLKQIVKLIEVSQVFYPFQNIMSSLFQFFTFYPKEKLNDLFDKKKGIIESNLRDTILHYKQKNIIRARNSMTNGRFDYAYKELKSILSEDSENIQALHLINQCFNKLSYKNQVEEQEHTIERLIYLDKLSQLIPDSEDILVCKRDCLHDIDDFSNALEINIKLEKLFPEIVRFKCYSAYIYSKLGMKTLFKQKINEIDLSLIKDFDELELIAYSYADNGQFELAKEFCKKAYNLFDKKTKSRKLNFIKNFIFFHIATNDHNLDPSILEYKDDKTRNFERYLSTVGLYYIQILKDYDNASKIYPGILKSIESEKYYYIPSIIDVKGILIWELYSDRTTDARNTLINILNTLGSFEKFKEYYNDIINDLLVVSNASILNELYIQIEEYWNSQGKAKILKSGSNIKMTKKR